MKILYNELFTNQYGWVKIIKIYNYIGMPLTAVYLDDVFEIIALDDIINWLFEKFVFLIYRPNSWNGVTILNLQY